MERDELVKGGEQQIVREEHHEVSEIQDSINHTGFHLVYFTPDLLRP